VEKNTLSIGVKHQHEEEHQCEEHRKKDNTKKKMLQDKRKDNFELQPLNSKLKTPNNKP